MTRRPAAILALVMTAIAAVYLLRLDPAAGLLVGDGWYLVLANAISSGHGYRLISSATTELMPSVPPGFPLLIAPLVAALPRVADQVFAIKLLSIASLLGAGVIVWRDFIRHREVSPADATLIVAASLLTPALVFLATSTVYSECLFMLAQVIAVVATERITRGRPQDYRAPVVAALPAAAAMLIRTAAAALIVAAIVHLLMARRWAQAAVFAGVIVLCMVPWTIYSSVNEPSQEERLAHGGTFVYPYSQLLRADRFVDPSRSAASSQLMVRLVDNTKVVLTRDTGAVFVPSFYRGPDESGQEIFSVGRAGMGDMGMGTGTMFVSGLISAIMLVGWLGTARERLAVPGLLCAATLPMIAPTSGQTFRYLVPLAPYLVLFFWRGLQSRAVARIALLAVISLHLIDHISYVSLKRSTPPEWIADWRESDEMLSWMAANLPADAAIATTNPPLVYLMTNRKTLGIDNMGSNWARWKSSGVRYVSSMEIGGELPPKRLGWRLLFRSNHRRYWLVEMIDP